MCTDVIQLRLVMLFNPIASQADDVTRLEAAIPADAHAVPQHHAHTSCAVVHLQDGLDRER